MRDLFGLPEKLEPCNDCIGKYPIFLKNTFVILKSNIVDDNKNQIMHILPLTPKYYKKMQRVNIKEQLCKDVEFWLCDQRSDKLDGANFTSDFYIE